MTPRAGLDRDAVLDAAALLVDTAGAGQLTLRAIAAAVGVQPPSLYNHVASLQDVHAGLRLRAFRLIAAEQAAAIEGLPPDQRIRALATAHRRFARVHPGLYAAVQPSAHTPDVDPEIRAAAEVVLAQLLAVVAGLGVRGDAAVHAVRALRSAVSGFIALEGAGHFGMPQGIDDSFDWMVTALERGIRASAG